MSMVPQINERLYPHLSGGIDGAKETSLPDILGDWAKMSRLIGTRANKGVHMRGLEAQRSPFKILKGRRGAPSEEACQDPIIDLSALRWRCVLILIAWQAVQF